MGQCLCLETWLSPCFQITWKGSSKILHRLRKGQWERLDFSSVFIFGFNHRLGLVAMNERSSS